MSESRAAYFREYRAKRAGAGAIAGGDGESSSASWNSRKMSRVRREAACNGEDTIF